MDTTSSWTREQKLQALLRLPWTIRTERDGEDRIARVDEIPDAIGTGTKESELARDLYESLKASLECRLEYGDPIVTPNGRPLPWEIGQPPAPSSKRVSELRLGGDAWSDKNATLQPTNDSTFAGVA